MFSIEFTFFCLFTFSAFSAFYSFYSFFTFFVFSGFFLFQAERNQVCAASCIWASPTKGSASALDPPPFEKGGRKL